MSGADIRWEEIDVQLQGLNEHIDPRVLPPGILTELVNGEYTRPGGIRKRPGLTRKVVGANNSVSNCHGLVRHGNSILACDGKGSATIPPNLEAFVEYSGSWNHCDPLPNATLRSHPIAFNLTKTVVADMAAANGFLVYVLSHDGVPTLLVRDEATREVVFEASIAVGNNPRCTANGDGTHVLISGHFTATVIQSVVVDLTTNPVSVSSAFAIVTDNRDTQYHDTNAGLNEYFVMAYRQNNGASDRLRVITIDPFNTIANSATIGTDPRAFTVKQGIGTTDLFVNWLNDYGSSTGDPEPGEEPGWMWAVFNSSTMATVLGMTLYAPVLSGLNPRSGTAAKLGGTAIVFKSEQVSSGDSVRDMGWASVSNAAVLIALSRHRNAAIAGKPWQQAGGFFYDIWVAVGEPNLGIVQNTYVLASVSVENHVINGSNAGNDFVWPNAVTHTARVPHDAMEENTPWTSAVVDHGGNTDYHGAMPTLFVPGETNQPNTTNVHFGTDEMVVSYSHMGRYKSVEFGRCTYIASGCVTMWDGSRLHEVGHIDKPEISAISLAANVLGVWSATGVVSYIALFETVDGTGARHYSAPSDVATFTVAAATNEIALNFEHMLTTRRNWQFTIRNNPRNAIVVYRAYPGSTVFEQVHHFALLPSALISSSTAATFTTWTDIGTAASSNNVLYTTSGEGANVHPEGGATAICVHQDRLWLGGGEDPELVWFSKPAAELRPAEFTFAQRFRIPGQAVVSLESMDSALIALCERGVYAVFGEGPDAANSGGAFSAPALIEPNVGCINPRSTVVGPPGVFFRSQRGIELLNRQRTVEYIGAPVQATLTSFPHVVDAEVIPSRGQVRFLALADGLATGRVLVYDYIEQKWAVWSYSVSSGRFVGITTWNNTGSTGVATERPIVMVTSTGDMFEETPASYGDVDTTTRTYLMSLETGWLSFGRLNGYQKTRMVHPLMQRLGSHGVDVRFTFAVDEAQVTRSFTQAEIGALNASEQIRVYVPRPKQTSPSLKVRLAETAASVNQNSQGFAIQALSFEIGRIPGLKRLPSLNTR